MTPAAGLPRLPLLEVSTYTRGGRAVVVPRGELDASSATQLAAALDVAEGRAETIVLDLRDVNFLDSSGLGVILRAAERAEERGTPLGIVPGPRRVQRVFELSGVGDDLRWVGDPGPAAR